ncbi:MAG: glycosyltransferase family 4 protein [Nocardioides sp.]
MTRVLHVTDCYLPRLGGIEVHVSDLVSHQRAAGTDARVLTATPYDGADPAWVRRVAAVSPVATDTLLTRALDDLRPDVVHVHVSVWSPFASIAARRAARMGIPTLVTIHSMWSYLGPLPTMARGTLGLRRWPVLWSAVSDRAAEPIRAMLGPAHEVPVLPNAVDTAAWRLPAHEEDVPTLVSVGRLAWTKRPLALAAMLREVRDRLPADQPLRAVLVGDGPQRGRLEDYLARHALDDWVTVTGRLDRSRVRDVLASSSVYVAPAVLESFGIAALEARCAGLPVVGSSRSGIGEFITHGVDGLLGESDAAMVDALVRLLAEPGLRSSIAAHNREVVPAFGWDAALLRTGALYDRATAISVARRPRPRRTAVAR